jgi:hypothetical protein
MIVILLGLLFGGLCFMFLWWEEMHDGDDVAALMSGIMGMSMLTCAAVITFTF